MTNHQPPEPIGARVTIIFHDEKTPIEGYFISFADYPSEDDQDDDRVFFYAENEQEIIEMMTKGALDFVVLEYSLEY